MRPLYRWCRIALQLWPIYGLTFLVFGILYWLFRPGDLPPSEQLRATANVGGFLLTIAAGAGVAAMATIQFWKVAFQPRARFHFTELEARFPGTLKQVLGGPLGKSRGFDVPTGFRDLLDNPTEVVMGQLRASADFILIRPSGFEEALRDLAGPEGSEAVKGYLASFWQIAEKRETEERDDFVSEYLASVRFLVDQNLNLIHVQLRERWRRRVRLIAAGVAGVVGGILMTLSELQPTAKISVLFAAIVWGGFFAWLARDLVALVERRRS